MDKSKQVSLTPGTPSMMETKHIRPMDKRSFEQMSHHHWQHRIVAIITHRGPHDTWPKTYYCSPQVKGGRKRNGPGTAKSYFDRPGANCNGTVTAFAKKNLDMFGKSIATKIKRTRKSKPKE